MYFSYWIYLLQGAIDGGECDLTSPFRLSASAPLVNSFLPSEPQKILSAFLF